MGQAVRAKERQRRDTQGLPKSARFHPDNYGGEAHALGLATYWCDMMEFYYSFVVASGQEMYPYTAKDIAAFKPREPLADLLAPLAGKFFAAAHKVLSAIPASAEA